MSGFWPGATAAAEHNQDLAPVMPNNPNPVKDLDFGRTVYTGTGFMLLGNTLAHAELGLGGLWIASR